MIRPRSIKRKLQSWVVIIFVLTGTAGWMGIWGLLYISRASQTMSNEGVERARRAEQLGSEISAAHRAETAMLLASDPNELRQRGSLWSEAVASIGTTLDRMTASPVASDAQLHDLRATQAQAAASVRDVLRQLEGGATVADLRATSLAAYQQSIVALEESARSVTRRAFAGVTGQSDKLYGWIFQLQAGLFVVVLLCQVFSAWAGWALSRSLTGELNALKESAERISMGDLKSEVKVDTADTEIVALGEALDRLRVSLGKAMDRLTKKSGPAPHAHAQPAA